MMETTLAAPFLSSQIDVANRLHQHLLQWQITDNALRSLQVHFPGFDMEATLLKTVAINQLYGTQAYAVILLARPTAEIMSRANERDDLDLMEQLASFSGRKYLSLASTFAHFFIAMPTECAERIWMPLARRANRAETR